MKLFLCTALSALFVAGCGDNQTTAPKTTNTASSGNPLTAPVDYLGTVAQGQKRAVKVVSTVGLEQAIQMFQAQEGKQPASLNALVPDFIKSIPPAPAGMKYDYDPKTGSVKVVPQ
jgi:hypothetical protein